VKKCKRKRNSADENVIVQLPSSFVLLLISHKLISEKNDASTAENIATQKSKIYHSGCNFNHSFSRKVVVILMMAYLLLINSNDLHFYRTSHSHLT